MKTAIGVRIVITTAFNDLEYMMEAIEIGVDSFIVKPVDVEKLIQAIGKCEELIMLRKTIQVRDEEQRILIAELQKALDEVNILSRGFFQYALHARESVMTPDSGTRLRST